MKNLSQNLNLFFSATDLHFVSTTFDLLSSVDERRNLGNTYISSYLNSLVKTLKNDDHYNFSILTHSMGSAFGEGISDKIKSLNFPVNQIMHLNAYQASDIISNVENRSAAKTFVYDFQCINDPVINKGILFNGDIVNATKILRLTANLGLNYIHKSPISFPIAFWNFINQYSFVNKSRIISLDRWPNS